MTSRRRLIRLAQDHPQLAAIAAEEPRSHRIPAQRRRHLQPLQHCVCSSIDATQVTFLALPDVVPERALDPGDAGGEAVGADAAQLAGLSNDLVDAASAILAIRNRPDMFGLSIVVKENGSVLHSYSTYHHGVKL